MSTAPPTPSYQALYRACMKEAAAQGRTLMHRLVTRASDAMPRRAKAAPDSSEREALMTAWRTLAKHEGALCENYPQALLAEFAQAIAGSPPKKALSFDSLELMGDEQINESVEQVRVQQAVVAQVEAELTELTALICAAQGLRSVSTERNPLRPEVYVRSLRQVILQSPVSPAIRTRWMQHLGEAMGTELAQVYRELSAVLRAQGVVEARFSAAPVPQSDAVGIAAVARSAPAAAAAAGPHASTLLNMRELRRLLAGEFEDSSSGGARSTGFSATVPAALETLQEMKQVGRMVERLQQRQASGEGQPDAISATLAADTQPRSPAQTLGLEVVNLMVENIAGDARLLPPVQQAVRDLEPALLRLALEDPRFFSDRKHPARRLLDQMTQRSLAWHSADAPGFVAFLEPLRQAVEALVSTRAHGGEPFAFALTTLEEAWGDQQQRDRHHREKAVRALLQAEQRNLLAQKIAKEMRARAGAAAAPREIAAFLAGPWSQVLAQARLGNPNGAPDPGGYASVIDDLVWSAQPAAAGNPGRLMKLIPELVATLRRGLATIDYPAASTERFMDHLAHTHRQAVRGQAGTPEPAPLGTPMTRHELEALLGGDQAPAPWLGSAEAQHSGFMETHPAVLAPKPLFESTHPGSVEPAAAPQGEAAAGLAEASVQPGNWVEMLMDGGWERCQVTWTSPHGTLFMFTGAQGKRHSMTRRLFDKMLNGGLLRLVSDQTVVDGALDAVADAALRNTVHSSL